MASRQSQSTTEDESDGGWASLPPNARQSSRVSSGRRPQHQCRKSGRLSNSGSRASRVSHGRIQKKPRPSASRTNSRSNSRSQSSSHKKKSALKKTTMPQTVERRRLASGSTPGPNYILDSSYKNPTRRSSSRESRSKKVDFNVSQSSGRASRRYPTTPRLPQQQLRRRSSSSSNDGFQSARSSQSPQVVNTQLFASPDHEGIWIKVPVFVLENALLDQSSNYPTPKKLDFNSDDDETPAASPAPVRRTLAPVQRTPASVQRTAASVRTTPASVRRTPASSSNVSVQRTPASSSNVSVQRTPASSAKKSASKSEKQKPDFEVWVDPETPPKPKTTWSPSIYGNYRPPLPLGLKGLSYTWQDNHPGWQLGIYNADYVPPVKVKPPTVRNPELGGIYQRRERADREKKVREKEARDRRIFEKRLRDACYS
jgi:hypothetical protein